jgi:hypothetical protein
MRSGVCPKCSATAVHAARGNFSWGVRIADPGKRSEVANTWGQVT